MLPPLAEVSGDQSSKLADDWLKLRLSELC
jgi:hypothetical protein